MSTPAGYAPEQIAENLAALTAKYASDETKYLADMIARFQEHLDASRNHHVRDYDADVSAAHWFGVIVADLDVLPLLARQTSRRTGVQITGMESVTLTEASALVTLRTTTQINAWLAAHNPAWAPYPDARAEGVPMTIYGTALGTVRAILGECLRILERVAG